jgi:hypothetical protein
MSAGTPSAGAGPWGADLVRARLEAEYDALIAMSDRFGAAVEAARAEVRTSLNNLLGVNDHA